MSARSQFTRPSRSATANSAAAGGFAPGTPRLGWFVGGRAVRGWMLAAVIGAFVLPPAASAAAPVAEFDAAAEFNAAAEVRAADPVWSEFFWVTLKTIYGLFGGDPHELDMVKATSAMSIVRGVYEAKGVPELDPQREEELLRAVVDLDNHLAYAPAELDPDSVEIFRRCLLSIEYDLTR